MTHLNDESGQSRAQHNHRGTPRRRAYRSPSRPVVIAVLSLIAVVAAGLVANKVASAPSRNASSATAAVSLWAADVRPAQPADSDTGSVELGTAFRTSQAGAVTGIRFYKHPENTGRHTGRLWDDRGRLLTSVTFDNESASGWQAARLASPVALQTGRWYVVSYHAPAGRYAADPNYFRNRMFTSGVLQARAGVYAYGSEARYPTRTWRNASYYADVLFSPGMEPTTTPTTTAPTTPPPTTTPAPTRTAPPPPTTTPSPITTLSPTTPTTPPTPTTTAPAPVGQACTSPVFRTSDSNGGWSEGGYYVHNNMWNISKYPSLKETLEACSHSSWNVTATADDNAHNGEVKTYPNVHKDFEGSGAYGEPAWSSFKTMRSTFAAQGPGVGIYNIAYDIWMNGVPGNREIMIWTENHGQRPAGDIVASGVSFSGITWDVWATGDNGYLAFTPKSTLPSGSLDLKAMIDYLVAHGRVPASSTLGQVCFGVEVVSTDGKPATFHFTDFSVTSS